MLLGITVFALFLTATGMVLMQGQESSVQAGDRIRGTFAALRGLEAARSIRDGSFAGLTAGAHGTALNASDTWVFSGTSTTLSGTYVNSVTVTANAADWVSVLSSTTWKHGRYATGSVLLRSELTNWRAAAGIGTWTSASLEGSYTNAGNPLFARMAIAGNYAYIAGDTSSGGTGLYVVSISSTTSPSLTTAFALGATAYDVAVKGNVLYVLTNSSTQEIRVYDITTPASPSLKTSYNLSGSSLATSLALDGQYLYVGATQNASYDEFYSFDVSNTGAVLYVDSLNMTQTVNSVSLDGTGAYLAMNDSASEMRVVDIADPSSMVSQADYNISGSDVGRDVIATGTSALLGRQRNAATEEMAYVQVNNAAGPWYKEGSGSLLGIDTDPLTCYGFLAADSSGKAFQIVDLRNKTSSISELWTYNSTTGQGRDVYYDPVRDRVFVLTRRSLLIFQPSSTTVSCS